MKSSNYQNSEEHVNNARRALHSANRTKPCPHCQKEVSGGNYRLHVDTCVYSTQNAVYCKCCSTRLLVRERKFCNQSCAAKYNNIRRSPEVRAKAARKTSEALKSKPLTLKTKVTHTRVCEYCHNDFTLKKNKNQRFCSRQCVGLSKNMPDAKWGRCLSIPFPHPSGEVINLQSTWEVRVAEYLTENKIEWIRPDFIRWVDSKGKNRKYYPDFYLPEYSIYLDPKNSRVMERDKEKLIAVKDKIDLVVGGIDTVINHVEKIIQRSGLP